MKDVMNQLSENERYLTKAGGVPQEVTDDMRESERYYQKRHWTIEVNGIAGNGSMKHAYMRDHPRSECRLEKAGSSKRKV